MFKRQRESAPEREQMSTTMLYWNIKKLAKKEKEKKRERKEKIKGKKKGKRKRKRNRKRRERKEIERKGKENENSQMARELLEFSPGLRSCLSPCFPPTW